MYAGTTCVITAHSNGDKQRLHLQADQHYVQPVGQPWSLTHLSMFCKQPLATDQATAGGMLTLLLLLHSLLMLLIHADESALEALLQLAAAQPEAYTAFVDCCLRSATLGAVDMLAAMQMLKVGFAAVLDSEAALCNTAAVAGLASALTSLTKCAVQDLQAASSEQVQQAAAEADDAGAAAAACFAAFVPYLLGAFLNGRAGMLGHAAITVYDSREAGSTASSSGTGTSQAAASAALLTVVLARGLVQLVDAMEAAGHPLLFASVTAQPSFGTMLTATSHLATAPGKINGLQVSTLQPRGGQQQHSMVGQWQCWQLAVLHASDTLLGALSLLGLVPNMPAEVAADAAAITAPSAASAAARAGAVSSNEAHDASITAADGVACGGSGNSSSSGSSSSGSGSSGSAPASNRSSSSSQPVQWSYLLQVQPRLVAALDAAPKQPRSETERAVLLHDFDAEAAWQAASTAGGGLQELSGSYAACVEVCRVAAAAMPLPVVCNNLGCQNLGGVSEAAAACKACASCKCRYCSVACQQADWKRHKRACRSMSAAGETCVCDARLGESLCHEDRSQGLGVHAGLLR
jgi:hypothetical protein